MYDSIMVAGNAVRIMLTHIGTGLVAKGGDLKTFPIAGKDGKFVQATARIDRPRHRRSCFSPLRLGVLSRRLQSLQRGWLACGAVPDG
jgi:hypothetical protein